MTDREVIELVKDAAIYADARWIPYRERMSEVSHRYLVLMEHIMEFDDDRKVVREDNG